MYAVEQRHHIQGRIYLEVSWPKQSYGPAPYQPCWWAGSSWRPQCTVGSSFVGSRALGAQHLEAGEEPAESAVQQSWTGEKKQGCCSLLSLINWIIMTRGLHTWSGLMLISGVAFPPLLAPPPLCLFLSWGGAVLRSRTRGTLSLSLDAVRCLSRLITRPRSLRMPSLNRRTEGMWSLLKPQRSSCHKTQARA